MGSPNQLSIAVRNYLRETTSREERVVWLITSEVLYHGLWALVAFRSTVLEDSDKGGHTPYNLTSLYWVNLAKTPGAANLGQRATGAPGRQTAPRPVESSPQAVSMRQACVLKPAEI